MIVQLDYNGNMLNFGVPYGSLYLPIANMDGNPVFYGGNIHYLIDIGRNLYVDEEVNLYVRFSGEISYYNGKVTRIGGMELSYYDGRLTRIGGTDISYYGGKVTRIGGTDISYYGGTVTRVGGEEVSYYGGRITRIG